MNRPIKLLSLSVLVDSTRLASMLPKHALLTRDFKTHTFRARFSPDQILAPLSGMGMA